MGTFESDRAVLLHLEELAKTDPNGALVKAYNYMKNIAPNYFANGSGMHSCYSKLLSQLKTLEARFLGYHNLLDFHFLFETSHLPSKEDILDYIVWHARRYLMCDGDFCIDSIEDLYEWDFRGLCYYASWKVKELCDVFGITCRLITIHPGFTREEAKIDSQTRFHCFNIIKIDSQFYLIDLTLAQFFCKRDNDFGRLGVAGLQGPSVGRYMVNLKGGEELARQLFTVGYAPISDEQLKTYLDSFMLASRNGLYYEENDIILPYSMDDYKRFLEGKDSQLNHEKIHCLGKQRRPLKNPNMSVFFNNKRIEN